MPKQLTPQEYLRRANILHDNKYTYDISTLHRSWDHVSIFCPTHGLFTQSLRNHLNGTGCPKCAGKGVDWIQRFKEVHGNLFDYSRVQYKGYKVPVEIGCELHGFFFQTPDNHYRGKQGCPKCKGKKIRESKQLKLEVFLARARELYGDRFAYKKEQFSNVLTGTIQITCPLHGSFYQSPINHLAGKIGCRKCNNMKSAGEEELAKHIGFLAHCERRNRNLLGGRELDVLVSSRNVAFEYCGMYWHSCKSAEEQRKNKDTHYKKYFDALQKGVRVITIFESEWKDRKPQVKRLLRNLLGKSKGSLMARKCRLDRVSHREAADFFDKYHVQGGEGSGEHYGLFWNNRLVACMRFTFGSNDRGAAAKTACWTLSRYATRVQVVGGASKLFKAFLDDKRPKEVKSFSDNRYFDGAMYERLGFTLQKELPPDYQVWSPKIGLKPKSRYQRRLIPARLADHGIEEPFDPKTDPRTEAEMTFLMGCGRIYDCGKKRWVWSLDTGSNQA
jgi:G:T-mismatch repair DNA endonuclease (very short patch repair protein)